MFGTIAVVFFVTGSVVARTIVIFVTVFVLAAMEAAVVTTFEIARSGEAPTPTIITAPCFRLRSQSDYKY